MRFFVWSKHLVYWLYFNAIVGKYSIKAVFSANIYYPRYTIDNQKGQILEK